ncbi:MAG: hypothetical protein V3V12_02065 [Gammaproteobacteria bacterium]
MLFRVNLLFSVWLAILSPAPADATETFDAVLERMQFTENQHFRYQETRHLALLTQPWIATGDMFITADGMVMAQQSPASILTKITKDKLEYFDTENDIQRTIPLKQAFAVPGMAPFLQMLYPGEQHSRLEENYQTSFSLEKNRWKLVMGPRQIDKNKIRAMTLSGSQGNGPDFLKLEYTDGDQTEWQLSLLAQGQDVADRLKRILDSIKETNAFED